MERAQWMRRLETFLEQVSFKDDIVGVIACGSMVAGKATPHSDLDVQIILKDTVDYRERGNIVIDGLLIEYFANPPYQTEQYFEQDIARNKRITATMIAMGEVIIDKGSSVESLREKAREYLNKPFSAGKRNELSLYLMWDDLDNLQSMDLRSPYGLYAYYVSLYRIYYDYVQFLGVDMGPLSKMERYFYDADWRAKNALAEFPDKEFISLFERAAQKADLEAIRALVEHVHQKAGGFSIDGWTFRSKTERSAS